MRALPSKKTRAVAADIAGSSPAAIGDIRYTLHDTTLSGLQTVGAFSPLVAADEGL